ncbi:uncharacterized protein LOC141696167 [Apium graveolens]|uniref:uncharacterized protein LOC141696167 n=1 Tax=Apium graveolens TaxID=4045 RepID=UPI003D78F877
MVTVESQGHSGGVAFLWRNKEEASLRSLSKNHIDLDITIQGWQRFRLTGLYGEPDRAKRKETWQLIRNLSTTSSLPWVLIGDMNNVLSQTDKKGGRMYPSWLIQGFKEVLEDCNLVDMELLGYPYTWERGHGTDDWVEIQLDRAVASTSFLQQFQEAKLTNMEVTTSDHCPLLLEPVVMIKSGTFTKRFRFENAWLREPMCKSIVEDIWNNSTGKSWQEKIIACSNNLAVWGKEITGSFRDRIQNCKKVIKIVRGRRDEASIKLYQEECTKLSEIYV